MNDETAGGAQDWRERRRQLQDAVERHMIRYIGDFPPFFVERAEGSYIFDGGRRILDFTSGQMCATLGHNHPDVVAAMQRSCERDSSVQLGPGARGGRAVPRARGAAAGAAEGDPAQHRQRGQRGGDLHGQAGERRPRGGRPHGVVPRPDRRRRRRDLLGRAARLRARAAREHGDPAPNAYRCPIRHCSDACDLSCLEVGFELVDAQRAGQPAAAIAEPILSTGGVIVPPPGYFPA